MTVRAAAAPFPRLVRSELALAVARPRTAVTLAILLVIPSMAALGVRAVGGEFAVALNVALVATDIFTAPTHAVPVALVAADAFAAERAHRTLDLLRLAPVGSARLVALKSTGVLAVAALSALVTTAAALLGGLALLPAVPYTPVSTLGRELVIGLWLTLQLAGIGMLLLVLSALIRRTTGVVAAGLLLSVLGLVPGLPSWLVTAAPNGHWREVTTGIAAVPIDWSAAGATSLRAVVYIAIGAAATVWLLNRRDG